MKKKPLLKPGYYVVGNGKNYSLFKITKTGSFYITPSLEWTKLPVRTLAASLRSELISKLEDVV